MKKPAATDAASLSATKPFQPGWLRLTIAKKIALAIVGTVMLCVGTMAWISSRNLQNGFIDYLNHLQAQDLDQLGTALEQRYREQGNFEWLRRNPRALRDILSQVRPSLRIVGEDVVGGRRRARRENPHPSMPTEQANPAQEPLPDSVAAIRQFGASTGEQPPPRREQPPARFDQPGPRGERPPPRGERPPPPHDQPPARDDRPPPPREPAPPAEDQRPPPDDGPPPPENERPPLGDGSLRPPQRPSDPMGLGARLSISDEFGRRLIGPRELSNGIERPLIVAGRVVGTLHLLPINAIPKSDSGIDARFIRGQINSILWLAGGLSIFSLLLALGLARHLLRPVAALRNVTGQLARGEFTARAPITNRDELGELAQHVNEMAQGLADSEQKRRKLLADIAHELRTPLTVIRGEIEAMQDGIRKVDGPALESLHGEVLRLNTMVNDIHQLTMADAGDLHYQWHSFDLVELLQKLVQRFQARIEAAGLQLVADLPKQEILMMGDADRLNQVFTNLLENSIRYTDSGGKMILVLTRLDGNAVLALEDSAPGVPPDAYARLFERLYRVDQARSRAKGGTGLGLSICKALVEAHGGSIQAMPSRLGGVKMLLSFPLRTQIEE